MLNMRSKTFWCLAVLIAVSVLGAQSGAQAQVVDYRAGTKAFNTGQAGVFITFVNPLPSADYSVSVQATNTAGYSGTTVCTYFNVLHKTSNGFDVQHKRCSDGVPIPLTVGVSLDWIAIIKTDP
jgi:hypothetical protein